MMRRSLNVGWPIIAAVAFLVGCPSPIDDDKIEALGGECGGVPESEFHRRGQPCVQCHGSYEGDSPLISIGGTIFATPRGDPPVPVEGALVVLSDAAGQTLQKPTNCAGNFFFEEDEFKPTFPVHAEIICPIPGSGGETRRLVMGTRISRDGSCGGCHFGAPSESSPGWVFCASTMPDPPYEFAPNCAGRCDGE